MAPTHQLDSGSVTNFGVASIFNQATNQISSSLRFHAMSKETTFVRIPPEDAAVLRLPSVYLLILLHLAGREGS